MNTQIPVLARRSLALVALLWMVATLRAPGSPAQAQPAPDGADTNRRLFIPLVNRSAGPLNCEVAGSSYTTIPTYDEPDPRPDTEHADLNLGLRGYTPNSEWRGLVLYNGPTDPAAPQLHGLFADHRTPAIVGTQRVYGWDWGCNCRADPVTSYVVTFDNFATTTGETLFLPDRAGGEIDAQGYKALVIFASENRLTLKYTRDDDVVTGYTLHVENVCVEPTLLALYRQANGAGRRDLPALRPGDAFGRATGSDVGVAIRDAGTFMDPRSCKDWWAGRCGGARPMGEERHATGGEVREER